MADQTDNGKTLGQQYYEEVEALKAQGVPNAEAIRQVAAAARQEGERGPRRAASVQEQVEWRRLGVTASGSQRRGQR